MSRDEILPGVLHNEYGMSDRDLEVARDTVRPRSECPSCHPESHHKAEPFEKWAAHTLGTACQHCGQEIKRVPGGQGSIWVHTQSGMVVGK